MAVPAPTRMNCPQGEFELQRYPRRKVEPLQAWNNADLLLLEAAASGSGTPLAVNDEHGALATALAPCPVWTDSALAAKGIEINCRHNGVELPDISWSTQLPPHPCERIFLRVPKALNYFEYQLAELNRVMPAGTELYCAGMDKHLSPQTGDIIEHYFAHVQRHRGERKARLFSARAAARPGLEVPATRRYECVPAGGELTALANVFSGDSLDIGSRFLLEHLGRLSPVNSAADLACGNGVLGIAALQEGLASHMLFADESAMAIASARDNCARLLPAARPAFHHGDGLIGHRDEFELVLCNPPFHLGHSVDDYAGRRLLQQAAASLVPGGCLLLVANRHLQYAASLKRLFTTVEMLAQNRKFVLWRAIRG